ncbi:MAG TPA: alpha/beta hydrolase [Dehalococcoidia bacterium]|jgi:pimeloyl-ACP methyl ester carboxylesterase|nr:alpha/beta hydrolase [Dehalococcoidia bacterium]
MAWVEVNGTDIYYIEEGQGQPLIFLHGNSSCSEAWWQQFAAFRDRFRVIAYDSVNHGHSSNSPRDADEPDRVDELEGFLAALGIQRPILAGNSMGGNTLTRWATRHPGDALALIPSGSGVAAPGSAPAMPEPRPLNPDTLFLPIGDALTDGFRQSQPRMFERYLRIRSTATRLEAMRYPRRPGAKTLEERRAMPERVKAITSPMLIVVGALDGAVPNCERLHQFVPHSEYRVIAGAPHNVYYEAAKEYNAAVADFLERVLRGAPAGVR